MEISPYAGKPASTGILVNIPKLITAYYTEKPDPHIPEQQVRFGTSGHRGSSFDKSFNEGHLLAICQAICDCRNKQGISGPLFLGIDTHALSMPAYTTALEVFSANSVELMLALNDEPTPTPTISHAILTYNRGRGAGFADGVIITPSHNPPTDGGVKYNPANGGPADVSVTGWIEHRANQYLNDGLNGVQKIPYEQALRSSHIHRYDYLNTYVHDLVNVIDIQSIQSTKIKIGVDPMGGAGVHYWAAIASQYNLDISVINEEIDATFRFMSLDWDGLIRMDPSSPYVMKKLIKIKDNFDIAFACDTDHDRHGIVAPSVGLMPGNHYLAVAIHHLFQHRPKWGAQVAIGKSVATTQMIDRVAANLGRKIYEMPVGFKWYAEALYNGSLGFAGEESAGASFLRMDGTVWTTDKDGIIAALLSAEITATTGRDPGEHYQELTHDFGFCFSGRRETHTTPENKQRLADLSVLQSISHEMAGEKVLSILTLAPGNGVAFGGLKLIAEHGWFLARPSGTENIYKIYAESFIGEQHLSIILNEAQNLVDALIHKTKSALT